MPFGLAIKAGQEVSKTFSIPQPAHLQRSTLNQSLRDRAAKDTIGLHSLPRSARESVNAFCLPPAYGKPSARQAVFDLLGRNAGLEIKCNARRFIHPELNDGKEAVGLIVREKS
jgi:hypothetical protein